MAERGWQVTGIDLVEKPLERARERVREAGVDMRVIQGDVTNMQGTNVGDGYRLVLDTGTFHGVNAEQRAAMGREISAIAADDATVLLDVFAPRRRGPLPRGASQDEVNAAFPDWEITDIEVADTDPEPIAKIFKFNEQFYRLVRK